MTADVVAMVAAAVVAVAAAMAVTILTVTATTIAVMNDARMIALTIVDTVRNDAKMIEAMDETTAAITNVDTIVAVVVVIATSTTEVVSAVVERTGTVTAVAVVAAAAPLVGMIVIDMTAKVIVTLLEPANNPPLALLMAKPPRAPRLAMPTGVRDHLAISYFQVNLHNLGPDPALR